MRKDSLKIGVAGAGVFGNFHASKCAAHPDHDFVGIFDPNHDRVRDAADRHHTRAFDNYNTLLSGVDAVIIASPAVHHGPLAVAALRAGRHVLVEKPIASTIEFATEMVEIAAEQKLVLQVGHQERFVAKAIGLDTAPKRPTHIRANRFGPQSNRGTDVSVVLDLMIHDFDMACWIMGGEPISVEGETHQVYSNYADAARVEMHFEGGGHVELEASRAETERARTMDITYPDGVLSIDFIAKTLRDTTGYGFNADFANSPLASDSLGAAVEYFTRSIMEGAPVFIPGEVGLRALRLALALDEKL